MGLSHRTRCQPADHRLECLAARCAAAFPLMRCASSAGAALRITARAWRAIFRASALRHPMRQRHQRGASRAYSTGSLTHFNDGRDFPDLLATLYDYPGITVNLHCNQNNAAGEPIIFYGSEATLVINGNTLTVTPQDTRPQPEGYSLNGWTARSEEAVSERLARRASHSRLPTRRSGDLRGCRVAMTTPPTTSPTSSTPSRRASMWSKTRSSATTQPSPATWPTTLTSIARLPRGTLRPKPLRANRREPRMSPMLLAEIF